MAAPATIRVRSSWIKLEAGEKDTAESLKESVIHLIFGPGERSTAKIAGVLE